MEIDTLEKLERPAEVAPMSDASDIEGIFHAHLTVEVSPDGLDGLKDLCRRQGVKLTVVDLEKGSRRQRDVMTTSYYREVGRGAVARIVRKLHGLAGELEAAGYPVVRAKLEHESRPTISTFSRSRYHEVHIKLDIPAASFEARRRRLAELESEKGFVASSNPREQSAERVFQFVNLRIYDGDLAAADARVEALVQDLEAEGFVIRETKQETVVFDTRLELDAWWA